MLIIKSCIEERIQKTCWNNGKKFPVKWIPQKVSISGERKVNEMNRIEKKVKISSSVWELVCVHLLIITRIF